MVSVLVKKGCQVGKDGTIELIATADLGKVVEIGFVPASPKGKGPKGK